MIAKLLEYAPWIVALLIGVTIGWAMRGPQVNRLRDSLADANQTIGIVEERVRILQASNDMLSGSILVQNTAIEALADAGVTAQLKVDSLRRDVSWWFRQAQGYELNTSTIAVCDSIDIVLWQEFLRQVESR